VRLYRAEFSHSLGQERTDALQKIELADLKATLDDMRSLAGDGPASGDHGSAHAVNAVAVQTRVVAAIGRPNAARPCSNEGEGSASSR
jgi:hypothetical protein